jgi:ATP-binding protein involved in chromosome partitioning
MIVDLPPGTSDAPLTVMQTLNLDGFVIVTTPHELAVLDAKRSINMVKKMNLKVFGVVENMSGGVFGTGGGQALAEDMDLPFLGATTLSAEYMNSQKPVSLESDAVAAEYATIAENLKVQIAAMKA